MSAEVRPTPAGDPPCPRGDLVRCGQRGARRAPWPPWWHAWSSIDLSPGGDYQMQGPPRAPGRRDTLTFVHALEAPGQGGPPDSPGSTRGTACAAAPCAPARWPGRI